MRNLFNLELVYRVISVIIFIPIVIAPIIYSDLLLIVVYLIFNSIVLHELNLMKSRNSNIKLINLFIFIITFTFFSFIISKVTEINTTQLIIEIIFTIWLFDTFSYLGGKILGGKKLMPSISSGKTINGLLVGTILTLIISQFYYILINKFGYYSLFFAAIIITIAFLGDLVASLLKRIVDIKDSGAIMPGHGGLLDRLDSFIGVFFILGVINLIK